MPGPQPLRDAECEPWLVGFGMPWASYARLLPGEDLDAIYQALLRVPPIRHRINNLVEPTFCAVCRQEHGFGDRNRVVSPVPLSDTRFRLAPGTDLVEFGVDEGGSVTHFLLYWGGIEVERFERR